MKPFREIDYSSDIGIEAFGGDLADLFRNAALGLFGLQVRGAVGASGTRSIAVRSSSFENLLVDWLSAIITSAASHGELYRDVTVESIGEYFIEGTLQGEPIDSAKHELRFEVKAATYHGVFVRKDKRGYAARVIFDL
ncbi:MAG: archease [Chitinivibrionia bacterium]|nr:archease [Chitinivibrionia bacterium]